MNFILRKMLNVELPEDIVLLITDFIQLPLLHDEFKLYPLIKEYDSSFAILNHHLDWDTNYRFHIHHLHRNQPLIRVKDVLYYEFTKYKQLVNFHRYLNYKWKQRGEPEVDFSGSEGIQLREEPRYIPTKEYLYRPIWNNKLKQFIFIYHYSV